VQHEIKKLSSVLYLTLGKKNSCQVSYRGHSATLLIWPHCVVPDDLKKKTMPSALDLDTRHIFSLPSAQIGGTRHTFHMTHP